MTIGELETALPFCTHLIYGYAGVNADNFKLISLYEDLELDSGKGQYRQITNLKRKYPALRILLSVGGNQDNDGSIKYLTLLENTVGRLAFVNSAYTMVKTYGFDGIDVAWQFPPNRPKKIKGTFGSIWKSIKSSVGIEKGPIDEKADEHREQFTSLIREMKNAFRPEGYSVGLTVLPNVNSTSMLVIIKLNNLNHFIINFSIIFSVL